MAYDARIDVLRQRRVQGSSLRQRHQPSPRSVFSTSRWWAAFRLVLLGWALCVGVVHASHAEIRVSGQPSAVVLEIRDARLDDVIRALQASFRFGYRSTAALDTVVSGSYSGPLRSVISRLLQDHNFLIRSSQHDMEVVVYGSQNATQVVTQPAPTRAAKRAAAPRANPPNPGEPWKECTYDYGNGRVVAVEC